MNIKLNPSIDDVNLRDETSQIHKEYGYPVLYIRTSDMLCICADREGQQAAAFCPICLGTGRKIRVEKITVWGTTAVPSSRTTTDSFLTDLGRMYSNEKVFYLEYKVHPINNNYIYEVSWVSNKPVTIIGMYRIQYSEPSRMNDGGIQFYTCTTRRDTSNIELREQALIRLPIRGLT